MYKKLKPSKEAVSKSVEIIANGGVIVFPWGKLERRCFGLMCDSSNLKACRKINQIKGRGEDQVIAVNGYPALINEIAKLNKSKPLIAASTRLKTPLVEVLRSAMKIGAISFIFEAKVGIPRTVTHKIDGKNTVMVAGELEDGGFDFYTTLVKELHKKGIISAGTSANRTQEGTYHLFEQEEAYKDLEKDIDLFIYQDPLPLKPLHAFNLESCTTFNMTGDSDFPEVVRFGSVHPDRFKKILGKYTISKNVKNLPKRERKHHIILKEFLKTLSAV